MKKNYKDISVFSFVNGQKWKNHYVFKNSMETRLKYGHFILTVKERILYKKSEVNFRKMNNCKFGYIKNLWIYVDKTPKKNKSIYSNKMFVKII